WRVMRGVGSLQLVLLLALTSTATGLNIPLEVEQPPTIITHTAGPIIALPFDNTITIRCEARGNPPPEYRWTKDGKYFIPPHETDHTDGTLVLPIKHLEQYRGKYRCYTSNKLGTAMTEEIELKVPSVPKFPKEYNFPIVVKEGEPITLECNPPEGVAPRQIYWMTLGLEHIEQDERVSMGIDGNLYFSNALLKDSRQDYCCFAAFSKIRTIAQKTAMAVVVKTEAPAVRIPGLLLPSGVQTEKVLLKGEHLQLECIPQGYPTPKISWMKMGDSLPPRTKYDNFGKLLSLSDVDERDAGKYLCKAQNSAGEAVHYFDVIVEEPPKWLTEPPPSQLTVIGSDVYIKCSVSGKPQPEITWRRNGEFFRGEPEDSAVYQCEASNSHGSVLANINIMVINMAPRILTRDNQKYAVVLGGDVIMNCSVFSSPPSKSSWSNDEKAIEGERFLALSGYLQIIGAEKNDSGEYVCVASNTEVFSISRSNTSHCTRLFLIPVPVHPNDKHFSNVPICLARLRLHTNKFAYMFRYFVDDNMLQIMNVNQSDQGIYTCIARTSLDEDNATALLTVLDIPDAPKNVKISELKSLRNVHLSWIPGSDHNSSVTEFIVEYEENQWDPGRWKELQKVPGNQATAELSLRGHLNYQFRVYAVNAVGPGPPSEPTERYQTPPAAPERNPENIKIQGHLPHQMDISWEPLLPIEHNGPGLEYKVSYRKLGVEDDWREHLVKRHSFVVKNTSTFVPYEIKIQSRNSHGWGPDPKVVTGYSGEDVPTAEPRDVAVEVINTTVLRVSWTPAPPATVRGHLGGYDVHWSRKRSLLNPNKILEERQTLSFPGKRTHAIVPGLKPFSEYRLTVSVFNKKGNGPNSDPVTFNTPEGGEVTQTYNMQQMGSLMPLNETTLEVVDSQEKNITEADTTQWQVQGLEEGRLYRFHLSACTRAGCGPALAQETCVSLLFLFAGAAGQRSDFSTQGWFIGTMCAVALLTLVTLMACFVRRNKGGKYAVKEKEDLHPDVESQGMNDDTFCEYSDSEEKPLKGSSLCSLNDALGDSISRDSLVDYADGGREFNEDGSFIGEYSGHKHGGSVSEPSGPRPVTA
uniref:Cell adhesion molecule L1-like b n=1 Tax=Sander lucioperca TaxID=283035 RepID=A0A8D0D366_SANLU